MAAVLPPSTFQPPGIELFDLDARLVLDRVEEAADALGRMVAGLAFDDADLGGACRPSLLEEIVAELVRAGALRIADDAVHRRREVGDVGIDDDDGDALFDCLLDQRRGGRLVMGGQDDGARRPG